MPHEGYADSVMNNGPRFHSNVPVSELIERVTRAIRASDVSSAPPVAETADRINTQNSTNPFRAQWGSRARDAQHLDTTLATPGFATPSHLIPRRA